MFKDAIEGALLLGIMILNGLLMPFTVDETDK